MNTVGWDRDVEIECLYDRIRRRYQERRCLACGSHDRIRIGLFCATCRPEWAYCPRCEQLIRLDSGRFRLRRNGYPEAYCKDCERALRRRNRHLQRGYRTEAEAEAGRRRHMEEINRRGVEAMRKIGQAHDVVIAECISVGATSAAAIAERLGISVSAARKRR